MISSELRPLDPRASPASIYPAEAWGDLPLCQRHVELIEGTHIACCAKTGGVPTSLKKPHVFWDLLDYSSLELRRFTTAKKRCAEPSGWLPIFYLGVTETGHPFGPEEFGGDAPASTSPSLMSGWRGRCRERRSCRPWGND